MKKILFQYLVILLAGLLMGSGVVFGETPGKNPRVAMETSMGKIIIELFPKEAPETVKNFLKYVQDGFYDGTIFHRVIPGFMIQGGGFSGDMDQKATRPPIKNEASNGLKNERGTIAMARTADPESATAQFFINLVNNDRLNRPLPDGHGYAIFGRVVEGMEVVDQIAKVKTGIKMVFRDVPLTPVVIKKAEIQK
jgi:peptidyl-prolyl cis-trans isomerase A (cyclophilin A)